MIREGDVRIPSGCAIAAVISRTGRRMAGASIIEAMKPMHDRSNGLGGGFAGYGIYPDYKNFYAFHMFFDCRDTRKKCEAFLKESFEVVKGELIPTRKTPEITDEPIIWRYFVAPLKSVQEAAQLDGASSFRMWLNITVPLLTPIIFYNLVIGIIGSFQIFQEGYVFGNGTGSPAGSLLFYNLYLWNQAFKNFNTGYANAMCWFLFAIIMVITVINQKLSKKWVYYEE